MTSATMQRVQTLQSIESIDAPYLHAFTNPAICVITTLKYYLARTNLLRCTPKKIKNKNLFFIDPIIQFLKILSLNGPM